MIKRFLSYYKPHLPLLSADLLAALIVAACNLFYPGIVKSIINEYIHDDTPTRILIWAGVLLGIYLLKLLCNYFIGYYGHVIGVRMQASMRRDLFRKYEALPFSYFDEHKTGDLLSRLVNDLFDVSELAHHGPENLFLATVMLIGSFVMLSRINMKLTLIMFGIIPFIILFTCLSRSSLQRTMKASRRQISEINVRLENSITGVRETKSYVAEPGEIAKFEEENRKFVGIRGQAMKALGIFSSVMTFLTDLLYLVIVFVGGMFLYNKQIDSGEFAAFLLYIGMFLTPIQRFVDLFQQMQEGMTGFSRFLEIIDEPEELDTGSVILDDVKGEIVFDNVTFAYENTERAGGRDVLHDLDLTIEPGKTLALVGPSGGGKTTLCHLIPRFYEPTAGRITLDGVPLSDINLRSLRSNIGIVSQNVFLFDGTIRDNIAYGAENATDEEIEAAARKANIHDYVMTLDKGYDTEVGERGVKLSGGQKQRVAIARVFLKNPKLLILDEATSALDNVTEMQIQSALEELSRGRTVIVVAHRLSTVKHAEKIVVIDKTGIVETGTHEELMAKPGGAYRELYAYQFRD